jgi:hypothetical protein
MALSFHSSSSVGDAFLDGLRESLTRDSPTSVRLEDAIRLPVEEDPRFVRRYLYLYTIPILEVAGLLSGPSDAVALMWTTVHLCLSLHLRHIDHVLDSDRDAGRILEHARKSHRYLAYAQDLLQKNHLEWGPAQTAMYSQFYDYEMEVREGYFHDFSSLWRRVSPLCVVPETYLVADHVSPDFRHSYRSFVSWSLLQADCDDLLKDLKHECTTPVTRLVQERTTGVFGDMAAAAEVVSTIKTVLRVHYEALHSAVSSYPLWRSILERMDQAFGHREPVGRETSRSRERTP